MDIENRARDLLAAEYDKGGWDTEAAACRRGISDAVDRFAIGALVAALTQRHEALAAPTLNMLALGPQFGLTLLQTEDLWNRMAALSPALPEGYVLVPVEATHDQVRAALPLHYFTTLGDDARRWYRAMIAARPDVP